MKTTASPDTRALLANLPWRALSCAHAHYSRAHGTARRYAPGFAPIAAFADPARPDLDGLAALSEPGETLYLPGLARVDHAAWRTLHSLRFVQMARWSSRARPWHGDGIRRLRESDLPAIEALLKAANVTLWGPAMLGVGEHYGLFDGRGQLVSMAAMRMAGGGFREVSTVTTHPDHQGRGHAAAVTLEVAARIESAGEVPFLHVSEADPRAIALYTRCGFEPVQAVPLAVVQGAMAAH